MPKLQDMTIRQKLMAIIMIPSAAIMLLAVTTLVVWEQIDSRHYLSKDILSHAEMLAATQTIRKEGIETPIVALTAHALQEDGQKCIDAGCNEYLSKQLDKRRLAEELCKYLPPKDELLSKQVDSVKSQVDDLSALCMTGLHINLARRKPWKSKTTRKY